MTGHDNESYAISTGAKISRDGGNVDVRLYPKDKVRFRNLVNVDDPDAVKQCGAKYIVIHKKVLEETEQAEKDHINKRLRLYADNMMRKLSRRYGEPVHKGGTISLAPYYEDDGIAVFMIR